METHSSILAWRIPMDRGAWRAAVHGVAKRRTRLSDWAHEHKAVKSSWACNSYLLPDSGAEAGCPAAPGWVFQSHLVGFLGNKAVEVPLSFGNLPSSCDSWDFKRRNLTWNWVWLRNRSFCEPAFNGSVSSLVRNTSPGLHVVFQKLIDTNWWCWRSHYWKCRSSWWIFPCSILNSSFSSSY